MARVMKASRDRDPSPSPVGSSKVTGYLLEYILALAAEFYLTLKVFARTRFRILQACNPPTLSSNSTISKAFRCAFIFDHHDSP